MTPGADPDNIKRGAQLELSQGRQRFGRSNQPFTECIHGFLSVQRIFSMHSMPLLGSLEGSPQENVKKLVMSLNL